MLVSREDQNLALSRKWTVDGTGYAVAKIERKKASFHRIAAGALPGFMVDHINRDRLDNRRSNLRIADRSLNTHNAKKAPFASSRYRGVTWRGNERQWEAGIKIAGKTIYLGRYSTQREAAEAYDRAARDHYGANANANL